ncbi:MAG: SDR family oxidoreductase [Pseudomonadales bacterium]|nr:SDR family oxidoreductase [Pseudomonadales bacterium]
MKWALVTGGCMRVGAYINEQLAAQGWSLILHYNQSSTQAKTLQHNLETKYKIQTRLWQQDLTICNCIEPSLKTLLGDNIHIDLLINNASIFATSDITTSTLEQIQNNMSIHLTAPWILTQIIAQQNKKAQIINILDANLAHRYTSKSAYFISKKALETLTELSAIELAPIIRVNAIAFGFILPPSTQGNKQEKPIVKSEMNLMQMPIALEEIINTIMYLQNSPSITGQIVNLDAGSHLKCPPYMLKN